MKSVADTSRRPVNLAAGQVEQLEGAGYLVLPNVLAAEDCTRWSQAVDDIWRREQGKEHDYTHEPGVQFVQNLLQHSLLFERCVTEPVVVEAARVVLGPDVLMSVVNGRRADPGFGNQPLHDLNRRRGKPFLTCNAIWCLDDFTELNGTRVIPGSHESAERFLARMDDPSLPHPDERTIVAPRGSVIIFNSHLIHAGSANRENGPRRSIQTQFAAAGVRTHYDWTALPQAIARQLTPASRRLLGLPAPWWSPLGRAEPRDPGWPGQRLEGGCRR